ncbi:MAG TPA: hypothetical protein PK559_10470, partial [Ignavibacteriaceae bacterium]|nr:hypothetical protein [Ignavibacteriaceae bacterium]
MKPIKLILLFFLCCSMHQQAQQFTIGTYLDMEYTGDTRMYPLLDSLGINTLVTWTPLGYQSILQNYNLLAFKEDSPQDAVSYYARGYYKKWEASENQTNLLGTGVKHKGGNPSTYNDTLCWTSGDGTQKIDRLVHGPDYRQDKFYRLFFEAPSKIYFSANYYLAIENHPSFNTSLNDTVCKISVVFRYLKKVGSTELGYFSETLDSMYIKVGDFGGNYFNKKTLSYQYPSYITSLRGKDLMLENLSASDTAYIDDIQETGIEFRVDWIGAKKLNVYGVEVYDDRIWSRYISPFTRQEVINEIDSFANQYSAWNNIKYWYVHDEPQTLDLYEPFRVIDSILSAKSKPNIITTFYQQWEGRRNGDATIKKFKSLANPKQILIDYYPFWKGNTAQYGLELLQPILQEVYLEDADFWYTAQAFGDTNSCSSNTGTWKTPAAEELNASVMLSLAHGAKGVLYWKFINTLPINAVCDTFFTSIIDTHLTKHALWYPIKMINNRLKNKFGKTLLTVDYTGKYSSLKRIVTETEPTSRSEEYLSIVAIDDEVLNFHAGLMDSKFDTDNKFFLLTNLLTTSPRSCNLSIQSPFTSYINIRVRNIEGGFDDTFIGSTIYTDALEAGEGKLYQLAPVIKYG